VFTRCVVVESRLNAQCLAGTSKDDDVITKSKQVADCGDGRIIPRYPSVCTSDIAVSGSKADCASRHLSRADMGLLA